MVWTHRALARALLARETIFTRLFRIQRGELFQVLILELYEFITKKSFDRLLVETDAPYLLSRTMSKVLGTRRNEPAYLKFVIAELARFRRCPESEIRDASVENACRFFDIELPM